jgi:hypothetical protein
MSWVFYKKLDQRPSVCAAETVDPAVGILFYIFSSCLLFAYVFMYMYVSVLAYWLLSVSFEPSLSLPFLYLPSRFVFLSGSFSYFFICLKFIEMNV